MRRAGTVLLAVVSASRGQATGGCDYGWGYRSMCVAAGEALSRAKDARNNEPKSRWKAKVQRSTLH